MECPRLYGMDRFVRCQGAWDRRQPFGTSRLGNATLDLSGWRMHMIHGPWCSNHHAINGKNTIYSGKSPFIMGKSTISMTIENNNEIVKFTRTKTMVVYNHHIRICFKNASA